MEDDTSALEVPWTLIDSLPIRLEVPEFSVLIELASMLCPRRSSRISPPQSIHMKRPVGVSIQIGV